MSLPFLSSDEYDDLAHQHYDAGEYEQALGVLREGLGRYPDSVDLVLGVGFVRLAREEYAWAHQKFSEALALDPENEDAWVGLGETLLKFGRHQAALEAFAATDALEMDDPMEIGLAIGRVLYREGLYHDARQRFTALLARFPDSAEVMAGLAYTLHALGDELGARRELRRALALDAELYDARIYLSHLLHERGDLEGALQELEHVPVEEHFDSLPLWRLIELRRALRGCAEDDPSLVPYHARLAELGSEPDAVDHLLAEVEAAFEGISGAGDPGAVPVRRTEE